MTSSHANKLTSSCEFRQVLETKQESDLLEEWKKTFPEMLDESTVESLN